MKAVPRRQRRGKGQGLSNREPAPGRMDSPTPLRPAWGTLCVLLALLSFPPPSCLPVQQLCGCGSGTNRTRVRGWVLSDTGAEHVFPGQEMGENCYFYIKINPDMLRSRVLSLHEFGGWNPPWIPQRVQAQGPSWCQEGWWLRSSPSPSALGWGGDSCTRSDPPRAWSLPPRHSPATWQVVLDFGSLYSSEGWDSGWSSR